ncbi:proteasome ATPase [uncultured Bifidobacterium sp.]|uniref:proteasome ATPase n=1 Tax=uncultured Bifidobacterium sp. TaxID=165187 RepID=UPI002613D842|nr:proteasome ATPase [uncultured Bifidobacterium sp.]
MNMHGDDGGVTGTGDAALRTVDGLAEENDSLRSRNHALASALQRAGKELEKAKARLDQVNEPPMTIGTMMSVDSVRFDSQGVRHATAEVMVGSRRLIVAVSAGVELSTLSRGDAVALNDSMVLVAVRNVDRLGQVRRVQRTLDDGRLIVTDGSGGSSVLDRASSLSDSPLTADDSVVVDPTGRFAVEVVNGHDDADLVLEETPDVSFDDIGGLDSQIGRIRDAVELPYLHRGLFERYNLRPPKGVLLYGPPGNGKTLIAKAVANSLAGMSGARGVFLSVKGPELLNKYVGESERLIRVIFRRARERAAAGRPVIVFIDEMDSLLRTRGTGVSSDVETTIVPQFLSEMDGVDSLDNVIVIGASNRVDMIDPAVLRPGRLDVKIRVDRPRRSEAQAILGHYLTNDLPFDDGVRPEELVGLLASDIYRVDENRHVCDIRDDQGRWNPVWFSDLTSGAMLRNIVDRAKTDAVKSSIVSGSDVAIGVSMLAAAVQEEFDQTRDEVLDADPVQWARVNGIGDGRVSAIRRPGEAAL